MRGGGGGGGGRRNGRPPLNNEIGQCWYKSLCATSVLSFPEAEMEVNGLGKVWVDPGDEIWTEDVSVNRKWSVSEKADWPFAPMSDNTI